MDTDIADGLLIGNDTGFVLGLGQRDAPAWPTLVQPLRDGAATERVDHVTGPDGKRGRAPHCLT